MAAKFKISLSERLPDFKLPVKVTMPNGEEGKVVFTVKHLKSSEIQDLYGKENVKDHEFIMNLATGWDLDEPLTEDNARELVSLYPSFAIALTQTYIQALAGQRVKN